MQRSFAYCVGRCPHPSTRAQAAADPAAFVGHAPRSSPDGRRSQSLACGHCGGCGRNRRLRTIDPASGAPPAAQRSCLSGNRLGRPVDGDPGSYSGPYHPHRRRGACHGSKQGGARASPCAPESAIPFRSPCAARTCSKLWTKWTRTGGGAGRPASLHSVSQRSAGSRFGVDGSQRRAPQDPSARPWDPAVFS